MNNRIKTAFDEIHAEDALKANTRDFLSRRTKNYGRERSFTAGMRAAFVAFCALLVFGTGGYFSYFTQASAISIDINPSIEISVNMFDRVIAVTGYNDDGQQLAGSVDLRNMNYLDAIDALVSSDAIEEYIKDDSLISVTVVAGSDAKSEEMVSSIENNARFAERHMVCYYGNSGYVEEAHEAGLSFGKYRAYLELRGLDPSITVEDVKGLTMRQIQNMIDSYSENPNGSGNGNGSWRGSENGPGNGAGEDNSGSTGGQGQGNGANAGSESGNSDSGSGDSTGGGNTGGQGGSCGGSGDGTSSNSGSSGQGFGNGSGQGVGQDHSGGRN